MIPLNHLIAEGESLTLELKKSTAEKDRACRTLCAFANGRGRQVIFGVTPAGKLVGQTVTDRTLEELAQEFQGFEPPLFPQTERVRLPDGLEALVVRVERASHAPVAFRGVPYERVLNTTRVMPRATYQRLMLESLHATDRWETQPAQGWTVDQLDGREIVVTLEESIRRGRSEDPGNRDPLDILRGLGLLLTDGQLSRAAVALFCKSDEPLPDFPQFKLSVARFKGTNRDEFLDNRQYFGNAFSLKRRAERFLIDWLPVAGKIESGSMARIDTPALPTEAVREALANAFIHRDYASAAGSVAVALYDDRLEIISAGELHFGLTPPMLFQPHESRPWNPWIASVFYRRGMIETWGRGTLKIVQLMQEAGLAAPVLVERSGFVIMTFALPVAGVPPVIESISGEASGKTSGKILEAIRQNPQVTIPELSAQIGVTSRSIERNLQKLQDEKRLLRIGPAKGGHWQVVESSKISLPLEP